jgi:hypothetical protein
MERVRRLLAIMPAITLTPMTAGTHVAFAGEVALSDDAETPIADDREPVRGSHLR